MDANKDGKVTQAEIDAFETARAAEIDANHDGKITADEVQAFRGEGARQARAAEFARMDNERRRQRERAGIRRPRRPGAWRGWTAMAMARR